MKSQHPNTEILLNTNESLEDLDIYPTQKIIAIDVDASITQHEIDMVPWQSINEPSSLSEMDYSELITVDSESEPEILDNSDDIFLDNIIDENEPDSRFNILAVDNQDEVELRSSQPDISTKTYLKKIIYPFSSLAEYEFSRWIWEQNISQNGVNGLLKLLQKNLEKRADIKITSQKMMINKIDKLFTDCKSIIQLPSWLPIPDEYKSFTLHHQDIIDCVKQLWGDEAHTHAMHFDAKPAYSTDDNQ
ncbi:hypothetical protein HK096_000128 [Nowakowskiella sp. JEL0078]|nr:hypothetical protein HK096_000128 [Nowakowskiella sp. JEL0078]